MPTKYVSLKSKVISAKRFRDAFSGAEERKVGYIFLGKNTNYENENDEESFEIPDIFDTVSQEKKIWDTMIAAKKVVPGDVEFVIPIRQWEEGVRYKQYDDTVPLDNLLSESVDEETEDIVFPMYVINFEGNVYKCLCNNVSSFSQVEPVGDYTQNQGFIQTEVGENSCYLWKYMYNVRLSNKFFTNEWMPVPYGIDQNQTVYNLSDENLVDGGLNKIVTVDRGFGYIDSVVNVASFVQNSTSLTISDDINLLTSNIKVNMSVVGTGILSGTFITNTDPTTKRIFLSSPTIESGGGSGNTVQILTRVVVEGDGTEVVASARLRNTTEIDKIDVLTGGVGYTRAEVTIYGSGTGATARAILPPKFGHGYNPAIELGATNVMITQRIGEVDASENNLIPTDTSFRQYGLLVNPYKYDEDEQLTENRANTVFSQTTNITVLSGLPYTLNEKVYQGTLENPTFYGYVVSQDLDTVRLTEVVGDYVNGLILYGETSGVIRPAVSIQYPDLEPYAGDILFAENIEKVERSEGQAEEIKLVFKF
jgi:gamma-glutamylcyclotransferase (GGCT)/AIG2-like uncharacterized protein YtfP